jgi:hypothetical protein
MNLSEAMIAHSFFVEFVEKEDIKRIKQCLNCNNFFIARDLKKKRCYSDEHNKAYCRVKNGSKWKIVPLDLL